MTKPPGLTLSRPVPPISDNLISGGLGRSELTFVRWIGHPRQWFNKDTSFGEASSRTQATDPNRRETLRIRTPLPGLRGEAKWLRCATPWSAKALTREVPAL